MRQRVIGRGVARSGGGQRDLRGVQARQCRPHCTEHRRELDGAGFDVALVIEAELLAADLPDDRAEGAGFAASSRLKSLFFKVFRLFQLQLLCW